MSNLMEVAVPVDILGKELWAGNELKISHEANSWLDENISSSWTIAFWILDDGINTELSFIFQSEEDAMAFKLRWS